MCFRQLDDLHYISAYFLNIITVTNVLAFQVQSITK